MSKTITDEKTEDPFERLFAWLAAVYRLLGFRVMCGLVITIFLFVGMGSAGGEAQAADGIRQQPQTATVTLASPVPLAAQSGQAVTTHAQQPSQADLPFDPVVADRLSHGEVTGVVLTGSYLTGAHLFTDVLQPSSEQESPQP